MNIKSVLYVLGLILIFTSFSMALPLGVAWFYQEQEVLQAFFISFLCSLILGLVLFLFYKKDFKPRKLRHREGCAIVTFSWIVIAGFSALPYLLSGSFISLTDAYFEAMSGFTTTGATVMTNIESMPRSILLWRSQTQWLGGMGIILLSIAILPLLGVGGMQLFKAEVPGISVDKISPRISETAKTLWIVYLFFTCLQFLLLILGNMSIYDALCHTFSTISTGGFSPKNSSIEHYNSLYIEVVITVFMLLGGINFILLYKAFHKQFKQIFSDIELRTYFGILGVSILLISGSLYYEELGSGSAHFDSLSHSLRIAIFQVVSIMTTTGFSSVNWESWPVFSQTILFFLMAIGGMAGSTAGGTKLIRLLVLIKHAFKELYQVIHPNAIMTIKIGNRTISREIVQSVLAFFALFLLLVVISTLLLTAMGVDFTTALSATLTSTGNVGPGLNLVGPAHNFAFLPVAGKWILILCMLLGRLEIYTAFVLFMPAFWKK